ncbi:hypothetical protein BDN70DRAFT_415214 [Pholiota conissans]|uniref:Uncharacterized protein n=1 Tax=Pholiota conissans TaxID=109636 RepID=A0A9P6CUC8_9AGAR|nr:hypothetical protein BDN70DRAFT_415214 [Pholiota conissans]
MATNEQPGPVPIRARLKAIKIIGDLKENRTYYVTILVDDNAIVKSDKMLNTPTPRWEWPDLGHEFLCHPSSTFKIVIHRSRRVPGIRRLVGVLSSKAVELFENGTTIDLTAKDGAKTASKIQISLSVASLSTHDEEFKRFMESVDANISRLDKHVQMPAGLATIGIALQFTKKILDIVTTAHPVLNASWTVLAAVYEAVQLAELQDDSVKDLAEQLRETLGLAKEHTSLLLVQGTTNVIEDIGRMSLEVASVIHEYTKSSFARTSILHLFYVI